MKKRNMRETIMIGLVLALGGSVEAEMVLGYDTSAPSNNVFISNTTGINSGYTMRNTATRRDMGQSFWATSDTIMESFSYRVDGNIQFGASLAPITVKIFESTNSAEMGTIISTQTGNYLDIALNEINPGWITFDIDDVSLTEGKIYTCMLSWDNAAEGMEQVFAVANPGSYAGGRLWQTTNGIDYVTTVFDMAFSVEGVSAVETGVVMVISHDVSTPSSDIIVDYTDEAALTNGYTLRNHPGSTRRYGQSFLQHYDTTMDSFSYKVDGNIQGDASGAPITVDIFESTNSAEIGTIISTQTGEYLDISFNPINPGWVTFDIEDLSLTAGKYYTLMISWDFTAGLMTQVFNVSGEGGFSEGSLWQSTDGGATYGSTAIDMGFSVKKVPVLDSSIISLKPFSENILEMVVYAGSPSKSYLKSVNNLVIGGWANVGHSIDGNAPFVVTNIGYSTPFGLTNNVIYVQADDAVEFFKIDASN